MSTGNRTEPAAPGSQAAVERCDDTRRSRAPVVRRLTWAAVTAGAMAGLWYLAARFSQTVWFAQPYYGCTTGSEEEALFSIWKRLHGLPVYGDMFDIPYAASFFNWLFYAVYAGAVKAGLPLFGGEEAFIPAIARCLTLVFHASSVALLAAVCRDLDASFVDTRCRAVAFSSFALLNLCYGLWAITCRPDIGAMCFELAGLWILLKYERRRPAGVPSVDSAGQPPQRYACTHSTPLPTRLRYYPAAVLVLYLAWALKQTSVAVITGYCLILLAERRLRDVLWISVPTFLLYGLTLGLGGEPYRYACLFSQSAMGFSIMRGVTNLTLAALKAPLLAVALAAAPFAVPWTFRVMPRSRRLVPTIFWVGLLSGFVTSMKAGAYTNYFFVPAAVGALCLAQWASAPTPARHRRLVRLAVAGAALFQVLVVTQRLLRPQGVAALHDQHRAALRLKDRLPPLPAPVLVYRPDLNLPWIQSRPPYFVYAFTYFGYRDEKTFRHGGMGGLIEKEYFGTVVLPAGAPAEFDGAALEQYERVRSDRQFDYYVRRPGNPGL